MKNKVSLRVCDVGGNVDVLSQEIGKTRVIEIVTVAVQDLEDARLSAELAG